MIRAPGIFRSITFWSGVLVMAFICWAWAEASTPRLAYIQIGHLRVSNRLSGLEFFYQGFSPSSIDVRSGHVDLPPLRVTFPAPFWGRGGGGDGMAGNGFNQGRPAIRTHADVLRNGILKYCPATDWLLFLPHWLVLLAFAAGWSGLLYGRHRRIRKATVPTPAMSPP